MTAFVGRHRLRFAHCDPAGIAYYPRYFELCDAAMEDWSEAVLGVSRKTLHIERNMALPTIDLHATFVAPSRLGDWLDIALTVREVGRSSVTMDADVDCEGERRFGVCYKQVLMDMRTGRAAPWPEPWRKVLTAAAAG